MSLVKISCPLCAVICWPTSITSYEKGSYGRLDFVTFCFRRTLSDTLMLWCLIYYLSSLDPFWLDFCSSFCCLASQNPFCWLNVTAVEVKCRISYQTVAQLVQNQLKLVELSCKVREICRFLPWDCFFLWVQCTKFFCCIPSLML